VRVSPTVVIFLLQIHVLPDILITYLCLGERFGERLPNRGNLLVTDTCGLPDIWITYLCLGERFGEGLPHRGNLLVTDPRPTRYINNLPVPW